MTPTHVWNDIMSKAKEAEFEIHSRPQNKKSPLWFRVGVSGNVLVISQAVSNRPSSKFKMERKITLKDFERVYDYFDCWINDPGIRTEVTKKTQNSTYIFALIAFHRDSQKIPASY